MTDKKTEEKTVVISLKNATRGMANWDNDLVEGISKFNFKPTQLKLVMLLSSKIKRKDTELPVLTFRTNELVHTMGFTGNNGYHLKKLLEEMRSKTIRIDRSGGGYSVFGWIVSADVTPIKPPRVDLKTAVGAVKDIIGGCSGENKAVKEYRADMERKFLAGTTTIKLDERITPFLIALTEKFTEIEMKYILGFKSAHAMKLYILLKRFIDTGWREDDEFELRAKLCSGRYDDWDDFKRRVLKPALEEINKTDIRVTYTKTGRIIRFEIRPLSELSKGRRDTPAAKAAEKERFEQLKAEVLKLARWITEYEAETWEELSRAEREELIAVEAAQLSLQFPDHEFSEEEPEVRARSKFFSDLHAPSYRKAREEFDNFDNDFKLYTEFVFEAEELGVPVSELSSPRSKRLVEGLTAKGFFSDGVAG